MARTTGPGRVAFTDPLGRRANLIDNALDAAPVGGQVTVTASGVRDRVVVEITDDGAGIPAAILDRIFDPFFTTKGVGKGTGLGLATVRRVLPQQDGEVEVTSRPGHTQFRVSLPVSAVTRANLLPRINLTGP